MIIRIIGIRRCLSSTNQRSRIPELLPRSEYTRKTALTAPDHAPGEKYTQAEYQEFLNVTYNPKVYASDPRKNLSDLIRADHREATERFRNRKLTASRTHSRDERIVHVANSKIQNIKNEKNC